MFRLLISLRFRNTFCRFCTRRFVLLSVKRNGFFCKVAQQATKQRQIVNYFCPAVVSLRFVCNWFVWLVNLRHKERSCIIKVKCQYLLFLQLLRHWVNIGYYYSHSIISSYADRLVTHHALLHDVGVERFRDKPRRRLSYRMTARSDGIS